MRIYIHTDLEGVSGVDRAEMMDESSQGYQLARELLMGDLNAAIDGAFAGGATQVTVLDSHGGGCRNFISELLDPRAECDTKPNGKWWGILDGSFDGTFFIGAHAMAGTLDAFLDHTQSSVHWHDYTVNGRRFGELAQWAMVAGHFRVPMLMVSGDEAACREAADFFSPIEVATVKRGLGRNRAELVVADEARRRIREAARRALALVGVARPFAPALPAEITLRLNRSDYCDDAARHPGVERLDARTICWTARTALDLFYWDLENSG